LIVKNSLSTAMEFSRCTRVSAMQKHRALRPGLSKLNSVQPSEEGRQGRR
jgi:hypothetical protein